MARRLLWICATLAVFTACSHPHAEQAEATPVEGWTLTVINHHWLDVSIYVMSEGQRSHVALVTATQTQSFEMPSRLIDGGRLIVLEADPVGGPTSIRTERLAVRGGETVQWTLETGLERSTVAVY